MHPLSCPFVPLSSWVFECRKDSRKRLATDSAPAKRCASVAPPGLTGLGAPLPGVPLRSTPGKIPSPFGRGCCDGRAIRGVRCAPPPAKYRRPSGEDARLSALIHKSGDEPRAEARGCLGRPQVSFRVKGPGASPGVRELPLAARGQQDAEHPRKNNLSNYFLGRMV